VVAMELLGRVLCRNCQQRWGDCRHDGRPIPRGACVQHKMEGCGNHLATARPTSGYRRQLLAAAGCCWWPLVNQMIVACQYQQRSW